ncbi:hypothetical protein CBER1_09341 [Cercospora berteroae]|uniref:Uncharacterized protein n=1 Tax=Cercospora berteroae TaxID=357750 RepID=A0A2S6BVB9_9PEZI|nr:hypothetical protein CBER1_09341 [Cercospora berteroae]
MAEKKATALNISRLEEQLEKAQAANRRLSRKISGGSVRERRFPIEGDNAHRRVKLQLSQVLARHKDLKDDHTRLQKDKNNWQVKYDDLFRGYQQSEIVVRQLAWGNPRRDSHPEDQSTHSQDLETSLASDLQVLHTNIECSISLLHEQQDSQRGQLTELETNMDKFQAEMEGLREDETSLKAQNVIVRNSLSSAQQAQRSLQAKSRVIQYECNALWEHLIYLEAAGDDAGEETVRNCDEVDVGWVQKATAVFAKVLQGVNERQKMYYVLH